MLLDGNAADESAQADVHGSSGEERTGGGRIRCVLRQWHSNDQPCYISDGGAYGSSTSLNLGPRPDCASQQPQTPIV